MECLKIGQLAKRAAGEARVRSVLGRVEEHIEQLVQLQTRIQAELARCHAGTCRLDGLARLR